MMIVHMRRRGEGATAELGRSLDLVAAQETIKFQMQRVEVCVSNCPTLFEIHVRLLSRTIRMI
jgi:hypothetical protein